MIESLCTCGQPFSLPESIAGTIYVCADCQANIHVVCAESLPDGSGAGDFDARLIVEKGPHGDRVGDVYVVGGVAPINLGKLAASHILLPGSNVSRHHATLSRLDFGPSRWQIDDNHSTNGLWINDSRVTESHELQDGDLIVVGDYELRYQHVAEPEPVATASFAAAAGGRPASMAGNAFGNVGGRTCPSCSKTLPTNAKVCTDCGIFIDTGKPLITSKGFDENELAIRCDTWIRLVSFLVWLGLYPIASEAFGTRKPYVVWGTAIITTLISLIFMIGINTDGGYDSMKNYMMWVGDPKVSRVEAMGEKVDKEIDRQVARAQRQGKRVDPERIKQLKEEMKHDLEAFADEHKPGEFHGYQVLTNAFLHDTSGIYDFLMHLGGNMLFLLVLGTGVNSMVGNVKTAIIYPVLAIAASVAEVIAYRHDPMTGCLGASGAVMGLAGMYLVLFPVHKVYMAFWIRVIRWKCFYKVWPVRGFWVVLFFIAFDVIATLLGSRDGVGHWAHLGGFLAGMGIAFTLLLTRQVDAHGGDLLSAILGKHAWALLGKPSARAAAAAPAAAAAAPAVVAPAVAVTSLDFPE